MSIINDALKKAQVRLRQRTEQGSPKEKRTWLIIAIIAVFLGFVGSGLVFILFVRPQNVMVEVASPPQDTEVIEQDVTPAPAKAGPSPEDTEPLPETAKIPTTEIDAEQATTQKTVEKREKDLVLNGTMIMDGEQFALINNQIFKEGDFIGARRILSISTNTVEILDNGNVIVLTTGRLRGVQR